MTKSSTSLAVMQIAVPTAKSWLHGTRGMLALVGLAGIVALAFGWYSLGFAAIAPVLYLLPCAVMMAMCAKGMSHGDSQSKCGAARSGANDQEAKSPAVQRERAG